MRINEEKVSYVASLAHLKLTAEETHRMASELDAILEHVDKLSELDTSNVPPMAQVLFGGGPEATLREDVERATLPNEVALANAPAAGNGLFKVPKVIER